MNDLQPLAESIRQWLEPLTSDLPSSLGTYLDALGIPEELHFLTLVAIGLVIATVAVRLLHGMLRIGLIVVAVMILIQAVNISSSTLPA